MVFGQTRTGSTNGYSAVFNDASRLKPGDSVRIAGIRVGTVGDVSLQPDRKVLVEFDTDRNIKLTTGTQAAIRYLNLVGDRYMELVDSPADSTKILPAGAQIPVDRTAPALDLDLLLGGLKPVIQGLNPQDVNALTGSLVQILQGQGGTLESLFSKTSSFTNSLADNNQVDRAVDRRPAHHAGHPVQGRRRVLRRDRQAREPRRRAVGGPRPDRHGHRVAQQRHDVAGGPARPGEPAAGRHHRSAEPTRPDPRQRQGPHRRDACRGCRASTRSSPGSAPTAPSSRTTSVRSPSAPAIFRAGPSSSRGSSRKPEGAGKSRCRNIAETPSSGRASSVSSWPSSSSRSGCSPSASCSGRRRCGTRRCSPRQAESPIGNDVTVSGIKVGSVSSVKLDNGDALVGFTINGKYALGSDTTAHIRTGTLLGERVLALESAGSGHAVAQFGHPDLADVVAVFADRRGRTSSPAIPRAPTPNRSTSRWTRLSADARPDRPAARPDVRRCLAAVAVAEQSQREPGGAAEDRGRRHRDPVRAQREGQRADPQRERSARRAQRASLRDHQPARSHVGGVQGADHAGRRQREGAGADAGEAQRRHRDAGEEPGQPRQDAARCGEVLSDTGRDRVQRRLLQRVRAQPLSGQILQPFLDYAFGFRRGVNAGQPPDNAGPRAELPFPVNGIPQPGDLPNDGDPGEPHRKRLVTIAAVALAIALVAGAAFLVQPGVLRAEDDHRLLPDRHRHLSRRRDSGVGGEGRHHRLDHTRGHADEDDPQGRPRRARSRRRQGRDRRAEPGRGALRPARRRRIGSGDGPDDGRRRGDSRRAHRGARRVGRGQDPIDAAGNGIGAQERSPNAVSDTSVDRFIDSAANALGRQRREAARDAGATVRSGADLRRGQRQHRRHHQEPADLRHRAARQQGADRRCSRIGWRR